MSGETTQRMDGGGRTPVRTARPGHGPAVAGSVALAAAGAHPGGPRGRERGGGARSQPQGRAWRAARRSSCPPPWRRSRRRKPIDLAIVYEDEDLIVIDKPAGLVVHPAAGHASGTLVNALIAHCGDSLSGIGGVKRPGIVHRLDKDTSGLLVVAKNDRAHKGLADQFADHGRTGPLERAYLALVWGVPERQKGTVDAALARGVHNREKIVVVTGDSGRFALTHYEVLEPLPPGQPDRVARALRTRDRAHASDPRAHGAYRPSASGRPALRLGLQDQGQQARRGCAGGPSGACAARRFTPRSWASNIRDTGEFLRFESPLPGRSSQRLLESLRA